MIKQLLNCLCCNSKNLSSTFDLGEVPLANSFTPEVNNTKFELKLNLCLDCFHSQLDQSIDPNVLFDDYVYLSGTSEELNSYFKSFVKVAESEFNKNLEVLDIASNDGSLLKEFKDRGHNVLGIDPAKNLEEVSKNKGVDTICNYWPLPDNFKLNRTFDVVIAMNVFAHVNNPRAFLSEIENYIHKNSKIYIQTSQSEMFINNEFDTVYHEHISFFNVKSFLKLLEETNFFLESVTKVPVHGSSYLWKLSTNKKNFDTDGSVDKIFKLEEKFGIYNHKIYQNFKVNAEKRIMEVQNIVSEYKSKEYLIACCGIAAKGITFLNYGNIEVDLFFDNNLLKQNKFVPGYSKKVESFEKLKELEEKCLFIIPAWNFKEEIIKQLLNIENNQSNEVVTYYPEVEIKKL